MAATIKKNIKTTTYEATVQFKDGKTTSVENCILGNASLAKCTKDVKTHLENVRAVIVTSRTVDTVTFAMPLDEFMTYAKRVETEDETTSA